MQDLIGLLESFGSPRAVLLGDFMLDRYVYGDAERISPEAPVPVLKAVRAESRMGGAGSIAAALLALRGRVSCVGVLGFDGRGRELRELLTAAGANVGGLVTAEGFGTIVKTRYVGLAQHRHPQQLIRVDEEAPEKIDDALRRRLLEAVAAELAGAEVLAIQDHDKGIMNNAMGAELVAAAAAAGVPVVVDPARIADYRRYRGVTALTPNRFEAETASGIRIVDDASLEAAARRVLEVTEAEAVVITLDMEGAYLMTRGGIARRVPTRPRPVYDVTGAGDEVLAVIALAVASKAPWEQAVMLANVAGGIEVERFGVVPVTRQEMTDEIRRSAGLSGGKIVDRNRLAAEIQRRKGQGQVVAFTNGCFDLLHLGHVQYLQQAREQASCLIVAINSDSSVKRLKGPARPVIGQNERAAMLGALECVDYVTVFDEDTPEALLELLRPDILVKGGTTPVVVGREIVEGYGGKVRTLDKVDGLSTTQIIDRILSAHPRPSAARRSSKRQPSKAKPGKPPGREGRR